MAASPIVVLLILILTSLLSLSFNHKIELNQIGAALVL